MSNEYIDNFHKHLAANVAAGIISQFMNEKEIQEQMLKTKETFVDRFKLADLMINGSEVHSAPDNTIREIKINDRQRQEIGELLQKLYQAK